MAMKLKTVEVEIDGKKVVVAMVQDGKPVYDDDVTGKETPFDADHAISKISALNAEAKGHREAKEQAEGKLALFAGIDDPEAARKAVETVTNLGAGELKTAAQVEELKGAIERAMKANYEAQVKALQDEVKKVSGDRDTLKSSLDNEVIGGAFARSKFISEKLILPADIAEATFRRHFALEDGKLIAKDANGSPVVSRDPNRIGQPASFEEAIEQLVDTYPSKDLILKGAGGDGSDSKPGQHGNNGKTMGRKAFEALPADQQMAKAREGIEIVD